MFDESRKKDNRIYGLIAIAAILVFAGRVSAGVVDPDYLSGYVWINGTNLDVKHIWINGTDYALNLTTPSGGTPYDQDLNTTDSVVFADLNVTGKFALGADFDAQAEINSAYEWTGTAADFIAGETITQGNFVYVNDTGYLWKADADSSVQVPVFGIALKTITAGNKGLILMKGWVYNVAWTWTPGDYIFLSTTAGGKTQTAPSGSGDQVQVCAIPFTEDLIYFDPDLTVLEIS